jgi:hypothetical protein
MKRLKGTLVSGTADAEDLFHRQGFFLKHFQELWVSLHPNGRLCCSGYEFMLCAANIKLLLCDCLEPRASTPAQADQIVRLLKAGLESRGDLGSSSGWRSRQSR